MKRRSFLSAALKGAMALAAPVWWVAERILPTRVTEATRIRRYPGPVDDLDEAAMRRPGRWAG